MQSTLYRHDCKIKWDIFFCLFKSSWFMTFYQPNMFAEMTTDCSKVVYLQIICRLFAHTVEWCLDGNPLETLWSVLVPPTKGDWSPIVPGKKKKEYFVLLTFFSHRPPSGTPRRTYPPKGLSTLTWREPRPPWSTSRRSSPSSRT